MNDPRYHDARNTLGPVAIPGVDNFIDRIEHLRERVHAITRELDLLADRVFGERPPQPSTEGKIAGRPTLVVSLDQLEVAINELVNVKTRLQGQQP